MPSILAEKCYYLIGHFTDHLLNRDRNYQSVTKSDVDVLFKLVKTINMLKKGSTINENMETFTYFLEGLQKRDAGLAEALVPYTDTFISSRAAIDPSTFVMDGYTGQGFKPFSEKEMMEKILDEKDAEAILKEMRQNHVRAENFQPLHNTGEKDAEAILEEMRQNHVGAENFQPLHNTGEKDAEAILKEMRQNHAGAENFQPLHNTNEKNNPNDDENPIITANPGNPRNTPPFKSTPGTKAERAKNRQARFWENFEKQRIRKQARKTETI